MTLRIVTCITTKSEKKQKLILVGDLLYMLGLL